MKRYTVFLLACLVSTQIPGFARNFRYHNCANIVWEQEYEPKGFAGVTSFAQTEEIRQYNQRERRDAHWRINQVCGGH